MKSSYRWVIVACGALMTCVGIGAMFSLAVYLQPMSVDTGWSRTGISTAMTLDFLVMGAAGFGWGAASDRLGPRVVVMCGALLLGLGLVLASYSTSLLQFQLTYGVIVGLAGGAFFAPMIAAATGWFEDNRSLAVSLVSAGMGVAPMTISPLARWLISTYDWRTAMMTIGVIAWALLIPTALLVRTATGDCRIDFEGGARRVRTFNIGQGGIPLTTIHRAGGDFLSLLRGALRADLPHGELCDRLRNSRRSPPFPSTVSKVCRGLGDACCSGCSPTASARSECW